MHKILGQVDILGSPIVLGSSIIAGLSSFFKEPAKARTPKQFARGIGKGSLALVKFSAFGFLEAIGQVRQPYPPQGYLEPIWACQCSDLYAARELTAFPDDTTVFHLQQHELHS